MTTLCNQPRNDFLIFNKRLKAIEHWQGMDAIRYFWCAPEVPLDIPTLMKARAKYFRRRRWIYDHSRGIERDTFSPGNLDAPTVSEARLEEVYALWKRVPGLKKVTEAPSISVIDGVSRTRGGRAVKSTYVSKKIAEEEEQKKQETLSAQYASRTAARKRTGEAMRELEAKVKAGQDKIESLSRRLRIADAQAAIGEATQPPHPPAQPNQVSVSAKTPHNRKKRQRDDNSDESHADLKRALALQEAMMRKEHDFLRAQLLQATDLRK